MPRLALKQCIFFIQNDTFIYFFNLRAFIWIVFLWEKMFMMQEIHQYLFLNIYLKPYQKIIFDNIVASGCKLKEIKLDHNALGSQCSEVVTKFITDPENLKTFERVYLNDCGFAILSAGVILIFIIIFFLYIDFYIVLYVCSFFLCWSLFLSII